MGTVLQFPTGAKIQLNKNGLAVCPRCGKTRRIGGTHAGNSVMPCYGLKGQGGIK